VLARWQQGEDFNIEVQPPKKRRLLSAVVKVCELAYLGFVNLSMCV
jgi:hypothetical protein